MNKIIAALVFCSSAMFVKAQTQLAVPATQPFGKIDIADLKMTSCDFEKDANAEILFDKGVIRLDAGLSMEHHIRIKIFNDFGKKSASIRLIYHPEFLGSKGIANLEAETINLEGDRVVVTPVEKAQIFTEKLDKNFSAFIFAFPNVKAGSIIEYKYRSYPQGEWFFQSSLPTRYSEIDINSHNTRAIGFIGRNSMNVILHTRQPFAADSTDKKNDIHVTALANVHSLPDEPYMTARRNNLQRMEFPEFMFTETWGAVTRELVQYKGFGSKLDDSLPGENAIFKKSDALKNDDERIAFIFDTVKNCMKWDNRTFFVANQDIQNAWKKKTGNSAEINLILYHLLKAIGLNAYPMVVCTRDYGRISPDRPDPYAMNNTVVYYQPDSAKFYVLDASNKFNLYNTVPYSILDTYGVSIDVFNAKYRLVLLQNTLPVVQSVFLNAGIKADGKMAGTVEITSDGYNKINAVNKYKTDGEPKYLDSLRKMDNNIKISSFKIENMNVDSLPLTQKIDFNSELPGSDENYIYFTPNIFPVIEDNPFKSERRFSDIDLGYRNNYSVNCIYQLPAGYKTEALPKSITIVMPDQSIILRRTVAEQNDTIAIRYTINHKKTIYFMEEYQDIRGFYKRMYELLNEQIVLKKG